MRISEIALAAAIKRAKSRKKQEWLFEPIAVHGAGRWEVRVSPNGKARAYWRGRLRGKRDMQPLGEIGAECSLAQARARAHELGRQIRNGGLKAVEAARPIATTRAGGGSLDELLEAYAKKLEQAGKRRSAQDVRSTARTHITPSRLAQAHAASVEPDEIVDLIRAVSAAGTPRAADKLRSFTSSAYRASIAARFDGAADPALAAFGIKLNPVAVIPPIKGGKGRPGERHLAGSDLRAFLRELLKDTSLAAQAVTLAFFLGGQRALQTVRVRLADVNGDIRILDPKGRREQAREHWLPLSGRAKAIVDARIKAAREVGDQYLFESVDLKTGKRAHVSADTMNDVVKTARDAATLAGHRWSESAQGFTLEDLRRTAETLLAKLRINKDDRAQLLSHGLGGVQSRHYDRHEYMVEKRAALKKWSAFLERLVRGRVEKTTRRPQAAGALEARSEISA